MTEIFSTIATTIFDHSLGIIGRQIGYLWNYKKNVNDLKMQVEDLDKERDDKSHCVTVAEKNGERIREGVKRWQNETDKISEEAKKILQEYEEKGKKMCLKDLCPNLLSRYQFGRRACKKRIEVERALTKADQIREVSDPTVIRGTTRALSTKGMFSFDSRKSTLEDIMKMLQDETKTIVGVYGLGGMGKTTLAKQVASRAADDKMFEEIAMGSVTQAVDVKEIQGQIASELGMSLSETSVAERAYRIRERLKGKKVLIILDDLWKELNLEEVGIPFVAGHVGCKMLLTSRFQYVLTSMGTDKEFLLGALEEEEAWKLFEERTVNIVRKPAFHTIGKEVAKRCEGLPVLIVTIAASLSKRPHLHAWNDALKQLKKMNYKEIHDIVNSAIESISYKHLEETHRKLLLLCGVMGGDVSIEEVLQYGLGWGLFDEEAMTIEQARNSLRTMILNLKESCLLLEGDNQRDRNSIRMHDVVRDVSISIAKKDFNVFSVGDNDVQLNTWPKEDVLRRCTGIIFRGCPNLSCLPQPLECPSLELLILSGSSRESSPSIADTFFEKAHKLRVLGMSSLCFSALPSSLWFLKNLQTLRVNNCYDLKDISIVGELKKLQALSFAYSSIEEVPSTIGQLCELRLLDLSSCSELEIIPAGLIASLSRLEELSMKNGFDRWDVDECLNRNGSNNVSLAELKHLPNLYSLEIAVPNVKLLSKNVKLEKWKKYEIIAGDMWGRWRFRSWLDGLEITRTLCLQLNTTSIDHLQHGVKNLFKVTECLCLGRWKGVKNVTPELDGGGFLDMKHLRIKQDYEIQYIVNAEKKRHGVSFPALESLHLSRLLKLQKICHGQLMEESFYNLKVVKVKNCNRLESLFSFSMAIGLKSLQEIQVSTCNVLEKIIAEKNREDDGFDNNDGVHGKIELAQLHKLSLKCLPKLHNFLSDGSWKMQKEGQNSLTTHVKSEEIISEEADFISSMPLFEKASFPKLEELELSGLSNLMEIWSHTLSTTFCNLTNLKIEGCDSLKYLFTPSITTVLVGLQQLTIQNCASMKHVVAKKGETKIEAITFPQLNYLHLYNLSNLTAFYSGSVEETDTNGNLDTVIQPLFNDKVSFPKMKTLSLSKIPKLTEIWSHQVHVMPCCNLTSLSVFNCDNMKYLLTPSITMSLVGLQELSIGSCTRMKKVVEKEERDTKMGIISFPQLSYLDLHNLSNLTTFYSDSVDEMGTKENLETVLQPIFSEKVKFPSLKRLEIGNCNSIKTIFPNMLIRSHEILSFQSLQKVRVYGCQTLKHVIPPSVARSLNQLEELSVRDCGVETIISDDYDTKLEEMEAGEVSPTFTFPKLIEFELARLPKLKCFYPRESTTDWRALEKLEVYGCDEIKIFTGGTQIQPSMFPLFSIEKVALPSSMSFRNLLEMEINSCAGLNYLFTPSIAMGLEKVQKLTIKKCSMVKAIVGNEGREATISTTITFPQLIRLQLEDLPNLTRLYSGVEEMDSNKKIDYDAQPLFNEKIQFPRLEELNITRLDSVITIWQNQHLYEVNSFCKLKEIEIRSCASLLEIFSSTESIISQICLEESQEMFIFQNLCNVKVSECKSLVRVFPVYVAHSLKRLQYLSIQNCGVLETIIGDDNYTGSSEEMATTFVFPKLTDFELTRLPKVECFYPRKHTIEWPVLKVLNVGDCDKVSTLDFLNVPAKQGNNHFEKVISNLEFLSMRGKDMTKILRLYVKFPLHLFGSLRRLTITEFHSEATAFLSKFLGIIHSQLQTFRVYNCSFQEIYEGEVIDHAASDILHPQLRGLRLEKLPELKYICKQDQYSSFTLNVFDTLEALNVVECPRLSNLVSSSVSFRLLRYLTISGCDGLINLIQLSTARSLEQLRMLIICRCEMIEEIISGKGRDGDEESSSCDDEIVFNKLFHLTLKKLPRLTNFCSSRNHTFNFPKLIGVQVTECPNMKTFCGGITTTPKLTSIYHGSKSCWEGGLNATVERISAELESKRLATTLPQPQSPENQAEDLNEPREECLVATNQEKVADISEEGKGKEVVEHFEKSEETPCHSAYLPTSQHVVSSSTRLEVQTPAATVSTTSSNNQFEAGAQIHDKSTKISTVEPRKEGQISRNDTKELGNKAEIHKNATKPGKESEVYENVTRSRSENEICEKVVDGVKVVDVYAKEGERLTIMLPSTSSNNELTQPTKEGQISRHVIDELDITNAREISPCLVTQARSSVGASNSEQKDFEDFIPLFSESFRALRARPMSSISAEQVQFVKEARDWLDAYVEKATECLERNKALSELKQEIAEKLAKMQALEDEIEAAASSIPNFR